MHVPITAIILAAGKGTRMRSSRAKVLHEVFFQPMLSHVLHAADQVAGQVLVVVGHQRQAVEALLEGSRAQAVVQEEQLGTGHAVLSARDACQGELVMILCGDTPLVPVAALEEMIAQHREDGAALSVMTTEVDDPTGYGRIIAKADGRLLRIVEEADASPDQRGIREVNAGIYLCERDLLFEALEAVGTDNAQGEIYLTDVVAEAGCRDLRAEAFFWPGWQDLMGVNSRNDLARAHDELRRRRNQELMQGGVTMYSPDTITVAPDAVLGQDCVLHQGVYLGPGCELGREVVLMPGVYLEDCRVMDQAVLGAGTLAVGTSLEAGTRTAPGTRLGGAA